MPLLIILLLAFAMELTLFIEVGSEIGVLWTLVLIVATAMLGGQLIRRAGWRLMQELQMQGGVVSHWWLQMRQQVMMRRVLAGLLLIVPGFGTDLIGVALFLWSFVGTGGGSDGAGSSGGSRPHHTANPESGGRVIEGEYEREK
ncbi:FxsA family protein [Salinispirillum sp. LH 10-3-1]|uniref:FxsA family protein n=1 Tax=Salinispirillum sp. LH 10-3-1 TaxID=2952525 RepID=A0AB38YIJ5_9GAMM